MRAKCTILFEYGCVLCNCVCHLSFSHIIEENQHGARPRAGKHEALRCVAVRRLSGFSGTILNHLGGHLNTTCQLLSVRFQSTFSAIAINGSVLGYLIVLGHLTLVKARPKGPFTYTARSNGLQILLSSTQARPGRGE